jgi:tRNA pseudouridine38-40 synthase
MGYYKILVAYNGKPYHGWQSQPKKLTVAGVLEDCFEAIFNKKIILLGASRTDAGVHALGQIAVMKSDFEFPVDHLKEVWNRKLPSDIVIRSINKSETFFYPYVNVAYKVYWYHFFTRRPLPFWAHYGVRVKKNIDLDKLNKALSIFIGTHDFRSFCTGDDRENTIRTIYSISVRYISLYDVYRIEIKGNKFLRYMIRRIVGACLEIASTNRLLDELLAALKARTPVQHLPTAPAHGLLLRRIVYHS